LDIETYFNGKFKSKRKKDAESIKYSSKAALFQKDAVYPALISSSKAINSDICRIT